MGFIDAEQSGFLASSCVQMCTVVNAKKMDKQPESFEQNRNLSEIKFPGCALLDSQLLEGQIILSHNILVICLHEYRNWVTLQVWLHGDYTFLRTDWSLCLPIGGSVGTIMSKLWASGSPQRVLSSVNLLKSFAWSIWKCTYTDGQTDAHTCTHTHVRAHTKSGLTGNVKHIRLSLPEKSCLISFCKYHLYTEDDSSCHLSVNPPV